MDLNTAAQLVKDYQSLRMNVEDIRSALQEDGASDAVIQQALAQVPAIIEAAVPLANYGTKQEIPEDKTALEYLTDEKLLEYTNMGLSADEILQLAQFAKEEALLNNALAISQYGVDGDEVIKNHINGGNGVKVIENLGVIRMPEQHEEWALKLSAQRAKVDGAIRQQENQKNT